MMLLALFIQLPFHLWRKRFTRVESRRGDSIQLLVGRVCELGPVQEKRREENRAVGAHTQVMNKQAQQRKSLSAVRSRRRRRSDECLKQRAKRLPVLPPHPAPSIASSSSIGRGLTGVKRTARGHMLAELVQSTSCEKPMVSATHTHTTHTRLL